MALIVRHLRTALLAAAIVAVTALAAYGAARRAQQHALQQQVDQARQQLSLYADALLSLIEHYRALPAVLALDPELRSALEHPPDAAQQMRLNLKLEQVNRAAASSMLILLDRSGHVVAGTHWRPPTSMLGLDFSFRPYFHQLLGRDDGAFYGVGTTTGVPGYFLSKAVRDAQGRMLGALVVKLGLQGLEQEWSKGPDIVLLSDASGIVFLASRPNWRYRELRPVDAAQRDEIDRTQQYPSAELQPLAQQQAETLDPDSRMVRVATPQGSLPYLWQSRALPSEGWTLHLLHDPGTTAAAGRVAALAAAGACLSLVFLLLFLQQRGRVARLQRRSREELEQLVKQHTAALRTAQDELVQAAHLAALGYGQSLEHLPQGVSVVDAELRLVAWNRRYIELFRVPPELMRAGRPIEDILRYNARRGLLGGGDAEEAIRRRLEHLQAGRPYVVERERPDGSVLEIRGNPLPGGGFVTSYADITAYRSAARDLRTLAATLERRVEQRTVELQEAKREAERANRSKSRFVAATVHDLQQPLNAARMFVSALRHRLAGRPEPEQALAANVEDALNAQEAILSGLLDIARLESGTLETQVRNLPLRPLFDTLRREFGILAQARGLELRCVASRAVVRSDEALLRRILQNFLSNAVRYTRRGTVLFGCRRAGSRLRIEVWDTGPGIPEHKHQEIFEEFRRLDSDEAQTERGAGLGLAIVDRIARLLGHDISLRSWSGRGSVFAVTLPLGDASAAAVTERGEALPVDDSALQGRWVWCIDDDARVREASRALLERWGCRVTLAAGAADALPQARPGAVPELVLLDYRLGAGHGPELLEQLAQRWGYSPPVILISAERDTALPELAAARGWGFLHKPVRPPALRALMKQLLVRNAA